MRFNVVTNLARKTSNYLQYIHAEYTHYCCTDTCIHRVRYTPICVSRALTVITVGLLYSRHDLYLQV